MSTLTRAAIEAQLDADAGSEWLAQVAALPPTSVKHEDVLAAVDGARDELAGDDGG